MMSLEPTVRMKTMLKYQQTCISGSLSATMRSALVKSLQMSSAAFRNFSFSYSSREKPLTTRIPRTFSSTDSFSLSYLRKTRLKAGMALRVMRIRPPIITGSTKTNVAASFPPMMKAMMTAKTSISGERTAVRMTIM